MNTSTLEIMRALKQGHPPISVIVRDRVALELREAHSEMYEESVLRFLVIKYCPYKKAT
jgi:hypothetical protein